MFHWLSINLTIKSTALHPYQRAAKKKKYDNLLFFFFTSFQKTFFTWKNSTMSDLPSLRQKIDSLDTTLVNILNERARVSLSIGAAKRKDTYVRELSRFFDVFFYNNYGFCSKEEDLKEADVQVYRPGREKEIYKKVCTSRALCHIVY